MHNLLEPKEAITRPGEPAVEQRSSDRAQERPRQKMPLGESVEIMLRPGRRSIFMVSFALFVTLNLVLSFAAPSDLFDKFKFPYKGWAWWSFSDLRNSREVHNVALLGSSLVVSAINNSDATYQKKMLNLANYHKAVYLDKLLSERFGGTFNTYNLAGPGQMPSDAYMTLHGMLKMHRRPDVVVYGVAPRDFYDSSVSSPVDTEPFRYLHRLVNLDDSVNKLFKSPWDKLNWVLERDVFLYGNALDMMMLAQEITEPLLDKAFPPPRGREKFTFWDRIRLLPQYKPGEIHPLAVVVTPQDLSKPPSFTDNTPEYLERYKKPDQQIYHIQWYFMLKLVELCKRERIELVVVNMPITLDNIRVLGSYRYMSYINMLRLLPTKHDVPAFELNDFSLYHREDYADGVHLNALGGHKLLNQLVDVLASTRSTRVALELAGHDLERRKSLAQTAKPDTFPRDFPL